MKKSLRLDFACPLQPTDFISVDGKSYCAQCDKNVLDLSHKSKKEIIFELSKYSSKQCATIPADMLETTTYGKPSFWSPFRKSSALIALFLLVTDIKTLLAQTKSNIQEKISGGIEIPSGYQRIEISGTIHDQDQIGIEDATITFFFDGEELQKSTTDTQGKFTCVIENYGGIKEIDMKVEAELYKKKHFEKIQILKENPMFNILLEKEGFVIHGDKTDMIVGDMTVHMVVFNNLSINTASKHLGLPIEIFDDIYKEGSSYHKPAVHIEKLHYPIYITDENGIPIQNARIEMHFPKNDVRWGITDSMGFLKMLIQLKEEAFYAKITISADGYHSKALNDFELEKTSLHIFKLKKKRTKRTLSK